MPLVMTLTGKPFVLETLKLRREFVAARNGKVSKTRTFILQATQIGSQNQTGPRFGFTVTKRIGNSVERNRIKRRLREVVRQCAQQTNIKPTDYVLIGKRAALHTPFESMVADLATGLDRLTISRENQRKSNQAVKS